MTRIFRVDERIAILQLMIVWLMLLAAYVSIAGAVGIAIGATILTAIYIVTNE